MVLSVSKPQGCKIFTSLEYQNVCTTLSFSTIDSAGFANVNLEDEKQRLHFKFHAKEQ